MMMYATLGLLFLALGRVAAQEPLSYVPEPADVYVPPKSTIVTTLLDFIKSRDDLSSLASALQESAGFAEAFDTPPNWQYTFFAPSNTAFNNTGAYFSTFLATPKGKWWFGNLLTHHYVPNSKLPSTEFNSTLTRFQTGSYLYVSAQTTDSGSLVLNGVSTVTDADIAVTSGVAHIIDHILDPSAQIYAPDLPNAKQSFIAGSCSDPALPYC